MAGTRDFYPDRNDSRTIDMSGGGPQFSDMVERLRALFKEASDSGTAGPAPQASFFSGSSAPSEELSNALREFAMRPSEPNPFAGSVGTGPPIGSTFASGMNREDLMAGMNPLLGLPMPAPAPPQAAQPPAPGNMQALKAAMLARQDGVPKGGVPKGVFNPMAAKKRQAADMAAMANARNLTQGGLNFAPFGGGFRNMMLEAMGIGGGGESPQRNPLTGDFAMLANMMGMDTNRSK